jgi:hypothetical protein
MVRRILGLAALLAAIAGQALAIPTPGFRTGPCTLGGAIVPGSNPTVLVVDDDASGVPPDYKTIQSAVTAAAEGDTILVMPGTYEETVHVTTPGLRIRGADRDGVLLDGESAREYGMLIEADRVVVENMTGHNYTGTVFFWRHVTGYWGRYLTAYDTGDYGLYARDARCGQFDNSYASGNADSGFYIGECYPCDAVITDIESTENALGYSGTNAGGNLLLRDSWWHDNGLAIVPNTLNGENRPPQRGSTIENNLVEDNNNALAPGTGIAGAYFGGGIVVGGGSGNQIIGNTVTGHEIAGIVLAPLPDTPGDYGVNPLYLSSGNVIWGNTVSGPAGSYDLAQGALSGPNNCWDENTFTTSAPPAIQVIWDCDLPTTPPGGDPQVEVQLALGIPFLAGGPPINGRDPQPWQTWPDPGCDEATPPHPAACVDEPDDNGDSNYANDGAVDGWLPALGI